MTQPDIMKKDQDIFTSKVSQENFASAHVDELVPVALPELSGSTGAGAPTGTATTSTVATGAFETPSVEAEAASKEAVGSSVAAEFDVDDGKIVVLKKETHFEPIPISRSCTTGSFFFSNSRDSRSIDAEH